VVFTAIFTAVIAFSTVAYMIITALLWKATKQSVDASRRSVEIAEKTFEASHRPYLGIQRTSRQTPPYDAHWWIVVTVRNFGNLPAPDVEMKAEVQIDGELVGEKHSIPPLGGKMHVIPPLELFPGAPYHWILQNILPAGRSENVNAGVAALTISVTITYPIPPDVRCEYLALIKYIPGVREFRLETSSTKRV
jgi:hypothetical protein